MESAPVENNTAHISPHLILNAVCIKYPVEFDDGDNRMTMILFDK